MYRTIPIKRHGRLSFVLEFSGGGHLHGWAVGVVNQLCECIHTSHTWTIQYAEQQKFLASWNDQSVTVWENLQFVDVVVEACAVFIVILVHVDLYWNRRSPVAESGLEIPCEICFQGLPELVKKFSESCKSDFAKSTYFVDSVCVSWYIQC